MFQFQAYGLSIGSVLRLQGHALSNMSEPTAPDDVHILYGDVSPTGFDAPVEQGLFYQVKPDGLWLNVPNIARFWVDSGGMGISICSTLDFFIPPIIPFPAR